MFCEKCGRKMRDDAMFCAVCGTKTMNWEGNDKPEKKSDQIQSSYQKQKFETSFEDVSKKQRPKFETSFEDVSKNQMPRSSNQDNVSLYQTVYAAPEHEKKPSSSRNPAQKPAEPQPVRPIETASSAPVKPASKASSSSGIFGKIIKKVLIIAAVILCIQIVHNLYYKDKHYSLEKEMGGEWYAYSISRDGVDGKFGSGTGGEDSLMTVTDDGIFYDLSTESDGALAEFDNWIYSLPYDNYRCQRKDLEYSSTTKDYTLPGKMSFKYNKDRNEIEQKIFGDDNLFIVWKKK